ncbi:hypothetical protein [Methanoculleus sp. 10]|uniref:hypothetical protein n=1 Tax=Methanoculleus sp. 10 TaxID=430615 RepID=UPI0025D46B28|nr:hypothetical protein [Methanoculleus sp. 10]
MQATQEYKAFTLWMGAPKMTAMPGNEFLQWLLLRQAKEEGYRRMENVGANNENLNLFKSKFSFSRSGIWGCGGVLHRPELQASNLDPIHRTVSTRIPGIGP